MARAMAPPQDHELERACEMLLATADLYAITLRQVRVSLEVHFGPSLSHVVHD